jgi:hypothetical protein
MSPIFSALQGTYAYLVIAQIIIVTGLFLTLLALIVRRIRLYGNAGHQDSLSAPVVSHSETNTNAASAPSRVAAPGSMPVPVATTAHTKATHAPVDSGVPVQTQTQAQTQTSTASPPPATDGAQAPRATPTDGGGNELEEKVRYLESKLLEYDILQEELSSLSSLKQENERLTKQVEDFQAGHQSTSTDAPSASATQEETKLEPTFIDEPQAVQAVEIPPEPNAEQISEPVPTVDNSPLASLETLLSQIDELTKQPPPSNP